MIPQRFTSTRDVLRRTLKVIRPAAAKPLPHDPNHWTHCVLIEPVDSKVRLTVTDGFRMHAVFLDAKVAEYHGEGAMVVGVRWLQEQLETAEDGTVDIQATRCTRQSSFEDLWTVWCNGEEESFGLPGKLPNIDGLIEHGEIQDGAGFHPPFFFDMVGAAKHWWDREVPNESWPLEIVEMAPKKTCTFTIRNSYGVLRMTIMPKTREDDQP